MISDFIYLEKKCCSKGIIIFCCSLPDPGEFSECDMIECGRIIVDLSYLPNQSRIEIELFENFKTLCVGETYQRNHFVNTILDIIQMKIGYSILNPLIVLKDFVGEVTGNISDIDHVFREISDE